MTKHVLVRTVIHRVILAGLLLILLGPVGLAIGSSIDPVDKWAWSTSAGWINFDPACSGCGAVSVYADHLEGYAWAENVGWTRLGTHVGGGAHTYANESATDYGVNRDTLGNLSGYAWSSNAGWIKFDPSDGGGDHRPYHG
jgi:hypothetical protein